MPFYIGDDYAFGRLLDGRRQARVSLLRPFALGNLARNSTVCSRSGLNSCRLTTP
jgi:hypothetical protein